MARVTGFARLSPEARRANASRAGAAAAGRHRWTPETARIAGRKGGVARATKAAEARERASGKG